MKLPRPKLTYANLIATIALFVALGGVSYAAVQVPKNSVGTEQLKKNAVATGKIRDGAVTGPKIDLSSLGTVPAAARAETASRADSSDTATNAANATNATNAKNATHASSADDAAHADSADDAAHAIDSDELGGVAADQYLTADAVLPSGETEVGVFIAAAGNGSHAVFAINFHLRLPQGVDVDHVRRIAYEAPTTDECPGQRQAAPGYFCFYEAWNYNMEFESIGSPLPGPTLSPEGGMVYWVSHHTMGNARGSWAYTAP